MLRCKNMVLPFLGNAQNNAALKRNHGSSLPVWRDRPENRHVFVALFFGRL
jgi:hypothetical protein